VSATVQGELWSSDPRGWAEAAEGRIRPLYEHVLERLHLLPGTRLLDAGCGSGLFAELAAQGGADVIGLDVAPGLVECARRRRPAAGYVVEDLERMPFGDGAFDVVTAFNSVLYAADPRRALAEIARVTTPSGRAVVTVGAGPEQAESAALIDPLAPHDEVPDRSTLDLADAVAAQLPAGPVAAAVRHSGRAVVEAVLRSFFAPRSRADGTVRMGVVFRCYLAERAR
jgi:SAM-dependent methyltransferase